MPRPCRQSVRKQRIDRHNVYAASQSGESRFDRVVAVDRAADRAAAMGSYELGSAPVAQRSDLGPDPAPSSDDDSSDGGVEEIPAPTSAAAAPPPRRGRQQGGGRGGRGGRGRGRASTGGGRSRGRAMGRPAGRASSTGRGRGRAAGRPRGPSSRPRGGPAGLPLGFVSASSPGAGRGRGRAVGRARGPSSTSTPGRLGMLVSGLPQLSFATAGGRPAEPARRIVEQRPAEDPVEVVARARRAAAAASAAVAAGPQPGRAFDAVSANCLSVPSHCHLFIETRCCVSNTVDTVATVVGTSSDWL